MSEEEKPNAPWGLDAEGNPIPAPKWERRETMKVTERLKEVVSLSVEVSKAEVTRLRRKIEKLTYGS